MRIIDYIIQKGYLWSQITKLLENLYKVDAEQDSVVCAAYGSELLDDTRMVDQPLEKSVTHQITMGDFAQLGQIPYLLVPFHGEAEATKTKKKYNVLNSKILVVNPAQDELERAIASEVPFPWNQFKLYALSQDIETN
ncbi:hypothetical protein [Olivibacter domesticus]|uniref:Uncharacterized protein n=1 Tax=Olivibacter domesticus TaxID=407022 RepID=A0A1H7ZF30_OLID1|nr:hypothetical protein [Olivibacter domesticus]SEM56129.1 hypothetical protein SAMN05661044_05495 [Olivibacter domesticus]